MKKQAKTIAQFGTFEVENYGDILFPCILEWELTLRLLSFQLQLFSPLTQKKNIHPIFHKDGTATSYVADAVVIGGGDIISFALDIVCDYDRKWRHSIGPHAACWAIPSISRPSHAPLLWNAPGVPFPFTQEQALLVRALATQASYLSVRDELSKNHLREAGVEEEIFLVPDTVLLLPKHWTKESLKPLAETLLEPFYLHSGEPLVFQMHPGLERCVSDLTKTLFSLSEKLNRHIVLLPIGYCHKDQDFLSLLYKESKGRFHFLSEKLDCKSIAAVIAHAGCFIGSSLHGNITAFAYGVPHLIYHFSRLKKLEGFSQLIQDPDRLLPSFKQMLAKQELLQRMPSRVTYQKLCAHIETHFDILAQHISGVRTSAVKPASGCLEPYLYLLHAHQRLGKQVEEYRSCFFMNELVLLRRIIQHFKRIASSHKSRKFWPVHVGMLATKIFFKNARKIFKEVSKYLYLLLETDEVKIIPHREWLSALQAKETEKVAQRRIRENLLLFAKKPLISCLLSVCQENTAYLKESIASVLNQYYQDLELCIVSYGHVDQQLTLLLEEYQRTDSRIKFAGCTHESHVKALQKAFSLAEGEYVTILNQHDTLSLDGLYEMVRMIQIHPDADLIYSDEDTITPEGNFTQPFYKPDWCPDSFLSRNYLSHLTLVRRDLVVRAGNFRAQFTKAYAYDLLLRITELTDRVFHVPKILYHRRSSIDVPDEENVCALTEAMQRRKIHAQVERNVHCTGCYTIRYQPHPFAKVSVIIPTKDQTEVLKKCLDSIYFKTEASHFDVLVVSNNSTDPSLFALLDEYKNRYGDSFTFYERNSPFNYSQLMNEAASIVSGNYLLFLNNDTEVISSDWMREMVGQAERPSIGAVGCKLLYFNNTVQHAGVVLGQKKHLGIHAFVGAERNAPGYFSWLNTINNYSAVTAACLLCRKSVFNEVGGFDEELKVDCNDLDLCLKLKEKGYHNVYLPHVELYHYESLSRGHIAANKKTSEQFSQEEKIIRTRWSKYLEYDPCYSMHFTETGNFKF